MIHPVKQPFFQMTAEKQARAVADQLEKIHTMGEGLIREKLAQYRQRLQLGKIPPQGVKDK
jgi:hypothetical protein